MSTMTKHTERQAGADRAEAEIQPFRIAVPEEGRIGGSIVAVGVLWEVLKLQGGHLRAIAHLGYWAIELAASRF